MLSRPGYNKPHRAFTMALFLFGAIFLPTLLIASRPFGSVGAALGTGSSVLCIALGWISMKRDPHPLARTYNSSIR